MTVPNGNGRQNSPPPFPSGSLLRLEPIVGWL